MHQEDQFICSMLRGEPAVWPSLTAEGFADKLFERLDYHGVGPLLYHDLSGKPEWLDWPQQLTEKIKALALTTTYSEIAERVQTIELLNRFAEHKLTPLLLKGGALAYTHYPSPGSRPHIDIDLLFDETQIERVQQLLQREAYQRIDQQTPGFPSFQACFAKPLNSGLQQHVLDIHWQLNNSPLFTDLYTFDELRSDAVAVLALGPNAMTLSTVHSVLLACVHRLINTYKTYIFHGKRQVGVDRLIWLYDIHLLMQDLSIEQHRQLATVAKSKGLCDVCLDCLAATQAAFASEYPHELLAALEAGKDAGFSVSQFKASYWRYQRIKLRALPNWRARFAYLWAKALPPERYMARRYRTTSRWTLPWWYLYRTVKGLHFLTTFKNR